MRISYDLSPLFTEPKAKKKRGEEKTDKAELYKVFCWKQTRASMPKCPLFALTEPCKASSTK